ncbi:radical SAM family heme chaperone HemW [Candidatus Methylopumilus universalis]|uniref:radical SAM family heme chaperone HemW n=1 Tax=Candidatus Methylopumilus universalis TaxID=2588536 RepID=UPI001123C6AF|nr:radical SAM family heme chaperone HemW [Candidatus Methylopumilus universalis]QDC79652.1 oxygen-independent coproporphyrinogen III oxidase-like protein [Candidatus Methylopumilus universalis]QDC80941.1 oxygen-independent coproporphyrinogen III oxidase-like protein [Candidatus Methylopumilus universalis]QDC87379.1 oxygen-independent coproporphyrinogen III oxidase-like protein [Candidatus Methylopumilus universalis]
MSQTSRLAMPPPLSLYIHIPWCVKKCPYCDFNSHENKEAQNFTDLESMYLDALIKDLEFSLPKIWGRKIHSIFFGGGTPSLFSGKAIQKILSQVRALTPILYDAEITLEANPGTIDTNHFEGYKDAGVTRVSLGIQSFNDVHLKALGRIHDSSEAKKGIEIAMRHFDEVNLDLMYALPQQTLDEAIDDAKTATSFNTQHLSFYHLTIEPNTFFFKHPPKLPLDDESAVMQETIEDILSQHGYEHYETSAFAKSKSQCQHNLNYWQFGDYLGIGAGAHSKLTFHDKMIRESRYKNPKQYMEHIKTQNMIESETIIYENDLAFEFMMNHLRLIDGFSIQSFEEKTGLNISSINKELKIAIDRKLITMDHEKIKPTLLGQRFLNDLLSIFLK